jgi:putative heme-binding domain-containing protein
VDHKHFRAAYAGAQVYQGDQYPEEYRGTIMMGNIHDSAVHQDKLTPNGASFRASFIKDFVRSADGWFRPVSAQTGPDGALWIMDWYDKYPCYQNAQADPNGVDREYGRIWRVVWVGDQPGKLVPSRPSKEMDLKKLKDDQLVTLLQHPNSWQSRQAQRLIAENPDANILKEIDGLGFGSIHHGLEPQRSINMRRVVWAKHAALLRHPELKEQDFEARIDTYAKGTSVDSKVWAARFCGEFGEQSGAILKTLLWLARLNNVEVRSEVAVALRRFTSGSLTVDTPPTSASATTNLIPHFRELLARPSVEGDFYYPHIVWMAMEPRVAADPTPFFPLIAANENSVSAYCARRVMRRICDLTNATAREKFLNAAVQWLGDNAARTQIAGASLDGLLEAFKSKGAPPTIELQPVFAKLNSNPALAEKSQRLAAAFGDKSAARLLIARINDPKASVEERLKGIEAAKETKDAAAKAELLKLLQTPVGGTSSASPQLKSEAIRALASFGGNDSDATAYAIVDAWRNFSLPTRRAAAEVLVTKSKWSRALLAGADRKIVKPEDISATARRALARSDDSTVREHADQLFGRYRPTGADKLKLIAEKRAVVLNGTPDLENGHEVARRTCFVCHKMYGEGADVGPDLTGVGRSTLDALLHNVIDPNEVIGNGFESTEVTLKDDSTVSGRVVEDTDTRIKLVASGPMEHTIAKSDIKIINGKPAIRKTDLSLMPEGLEQIPDKDFRDLIMFILNPPGDRRTWTPALRKELIGDEGASQKTASAQ